MGLLIFIQPWASLKRPTSNCLAYSPTDKVKVHLDLAAVESL